MQEYTCKRPECDLRAFYDEKYKSVDKSLMSCYVCFRKAYSDWRD